MSTILFFGAIAATILFTFITGFHDGCNVIATAIGSRSMSPRKAIVLGTIAEFAGPFLLGTAVAGVMASKILNLDRLLALPPETLYILVISAVVGAIAWNIVTWIAGLPSSSSHALIGGLIGAGATCMGMEAVEVEGVLYGVVLPLFLSPLIGMLAGYLLFGMLRGVFSPTHSGAKHMFIFLQKPGVLFLAASHGSNDGQKSIGILALVLAAHAGSHELQFPLWTVFASAAAIALGLSTGGWTIIKTVGFSIFRMQPIHSFTSQFASTAVVVGASLVGGPVSATQVVSSSVLGVGASRRLSGVRWSVARHILFAWLLTIPVSAVIGAAFYAVLQWLFA